MERASSACGLLLLLLRRGRQHLTDSANVCTQLLVTVSLEGGVGGW